MLDRVHTAAAAATNAATLAVATAAAAIVTMPDVIAYMELGIGVHVASVSAALISAIGVVMLTRPCLGVVPSPFAVGAVVSGFVSATVAPASKVSIGVVGAMMVVVSGVVAMVVAAAPVRPAMVGIVVALVVFLTLVV